jgi:hypothetical protein
MIPDPPVFVFWFDFLRWLLDKTQKFPKSVRFSFTVRIENLALDVIEGIIEARYSSERKAILRRIDLDLEKLRVLLRMCHDLRYLDGKGYEFASRQINEAGKMIGGWRKQQEARGP